MKYIVAFFVLIPLSVSASFDRDLYYGMQGDSQVTELQEFLTEQKTYFGPITGNFFSLTLAGVKQFQERESITPAVGYFGPKTRARANQILTVGGISSAGVKDESGSTTPVTITPPKTTNDVVSSLMEQIKLLQQQLNVIQQQQKSLQTIQQQQASTTQQIIQQTQTLQQIQQQTVPVSTSTMPTSTLLKIFSINIIPSLNSVRVEWQTNIPTNSKIFLAGGPFAKVFSSESGLSTRHIANATGLNSGSTYSYEIESITGDQVAKEVGYLLTKLDEFTLTIKADNLSTTASGWNAIRLDVEAFKNGQAQTSVSVSMTTPDETQNDTRCININNCNHGGLTFYYTPKTIGTHILVFSWNGVSKNIDIEATQYIRQDPIAKLISSPNSVRAGKAEVVVAVIEMSNIEENTVLSYLSDFSYNIISDDFTKSALEIVPLNIASFGKGTFEQVAFKIKNIPARLGKFKLEVTRIGPLIGQQSGSNRTVTGLPIITPEIEVYDQNLIMWQANNYNHSILGYSSPNQNENGLYLMNNSLTSAVISSIEWEKQTTGNLQVQNIFMYPSIPHTLVYGDARTILVKITYSGTPQAGDKITIKPIITLSTGHKLECIGACSLTWSQ